MKTALCLSISILFGLARPAAAQVLTLRDALTRIFDRNPDLRASELEIEAASARVTQAGLRPNPEISGEFQNLPRLASDRLLLSAETNLLISQKWETGGKRAARVHAARGEQDVAGRALEVKRTDTIGAARLAFVEVLANQERLANQRELTRVARQLHTTVGDRVAAGKVSPVEQTRAMVAFAAAQLEEDKLAKELAGSKDRLAALWGGSSVDFERVEADFAIPLSPPSPACLENNPNVMLAAATVESRRSALSLQQAARKPDLTFSAGFRRLNVEDTSAWVAGVSIPLPLFDKREGAIAEARVRIEQAFAEQKAVERRLRAEIARVRHDHELALLEAASLTGTVLPAAKSVLAATLEGYRLGKFEYLSVLDAQRTYAELQRRYIEAVASGLKAAAEMERLSRCDDSEPRGVLK